MSVLARLVLGIPASATWSSRRGFRADDPAATRRLESIGAAFVTGYHAALADSDPKTLAPRLDSALDPELTGFAYEGAAMGLAALDALTPWRRDRWRQFLSGAGERHAYMVHVGAGWAAARLGGLARIERDADPLLYWLVLDGLGFHAGYFDAARAVHAHRAPRLTGYAARAYTQGLGRSLWFVEGAHPEEIARTIVGFPPERRADLWSGVGLAAAYAGGVGRVALQSLARLAGPHRPELALGAAFAAKARERAANPAPHTELACQVLCGLSAREAAAMTDVALPERSGDLPADARDASAEAASMPAYEVWRERVRSALGSSIPAHGNGAAHRASPALAQPALANHRSLA